jgi:DNA ligase-1
VKKREAKALDKKVIKAIPKEEKKISAKKAAKEETKKSVEVMLASVYEPEKHDPTGWYMSEKLDGVRCIWDGKNLYSRNGNLFYPPQYFKDALPKNFELDGELWTKRDDFQKCVSIVKRQDQNDEWKTITYMVFDAPAMSKSTFKDRYKKLQEVIGAIKSPYITLLDHTICTSREQLVKKMDEVTAEGAEGMMIRDP